MAMTERKWTRRERRNGITEDGYGLLEVKPGVWCLVHEVAWVMANDECVVPDEFRVVQTCGNRLCVRPDHLKLVPEDEAVSAQEMAETGFRLNMSKN